MRLLIDECLSHSLVPVAHEFGHEAHHVAHLALAGTSDRQLIPLILERDYTLVTNNAEDFRRLYRHLDLPAGLILVLGQFSRFEQQSIFRLVLKQLAETHLINTLVEVSWTKGTLTTSFHATGPASGSA